MHLAKIIDVVFEETNNGLIRATSPQVKGLHVAGDNIDDLKESVGAMLKDLLNAQGLDVSVFETESVDARSMLPWVAVPNHSRQSAC